MIKKVETYLLDIETRQKCCKALLEYSENPIRIVFKSDMTPQIEVNGIDLLDCYRKLQILLEDKGYLIYLNGSRIDVLASGFLRDSTNGISVYQFTYNFNADKPVLNIFDVSDMDKIGTIKEQKEFMKEWKIRYKCFFTPPS